MRSRSSCSENNDRLTEKELQNCTLKNRMCYLHQPIEPITCTLLQVVDYSVFLYHECVCVFFFKELDFVLCIFLQLEGKTKLIAFNVEIFLKSERYFAESESRELRVESSD